MDERRSGQARSGPNFDTTQAFWNKENELGIVSKKSTVDSNQPQSDRVKLFLTKFFI